MGTTRINVNVGNVSKRPVRAPKNVGVPFITGLAVSGQNLTVDTGMWSGLPTPMVTVQWRANGVDLVGEVDQVLHLTDAYIGQTVTAVVYAANFLGTAYLETQPSAPVIAFDPDRAPSNLTIPTVTGIMVSGEEITGSLGTWDAKPDPTYARQWFADGVAVPAATGLTYTLTDSELGKAMTFRVTATNLLGSASAFSDPSTPVLDDGADRPPVNLVAPSTSGTVNLTDTLTASQGTWDAQPSVTLANQWLADGAAIPGATGSTFQITEAERGKVISLRVTAVNTVGTAVADSPYTGECVGPETLVKRYIRRLASGTATGLDWANAASLSSLNAFITAVGANGRIYLRADEGTYSAALFTLTSAGVDPATPVIVKGVDVNERFMNISIVGNRTSPWVFGSTTGQEIFRLHTGFKNVKFQNIGFLNCGNGCFRLGDVTTDVTIENCTARNVQRFIENTLSAPATEASCIRLNVLGCTAFGFSRAFARMRYTSRDCLFRDCFGDSQGQDLDNFSVGISHQDTCHDQTMRRCRMWNTIDTKGGDQAQYWNADCFSQENAQFNMLYDACEAKGSTDGGFDCKGGSTFIDCLSMENKRNWRIWGPSTMLRCRSLDPYKRGGTGGDGVTADNIHVSLHGTLGAVVATDCAFADKRTDSVVFEIDNATNSVDAVNCSVQINALALLLNNPNAGSATVDNRTAPATTVAPAVTGTEVAGSVLSATAGTWDTPGLAYTYQWCRNTFYIDGATSNTYLLASADVGATIGCRVFGQTGTYVGEGVSNVTGAIGASPPSNVTLPSITGIPAQGATLSSATGAWAGIPVPTYTYQWTRDGASITGETASSFLLTGADVGHLIRVRVTATNTAGSTQATSAPTASVVNSVTSLFVAATSRGNKDGSSFANAISLGMLNASFNALALSGATVKILADEGVLDFTGSVNITRGGGIGSPTVVMGAHADGTPAVVTIRGSRTNWTLPVNPETVTSISGWAVGNEVFRLGAGANHLYFHHIKFQNVGKGFNASLATINDVKLEDLEYYNVQEGFYTYHSNSVTNLIARRIKATGFSKRIFRVFGDSHDWLVEDFEMNSGRQDRDDWANGLAFDDTSHDVTVRGRIEDGGGNNIGTYSGIIENCHDSQHGDNTNYWNSDGISLERGNYNILIENLTVRGCTDGGIDIKATDSVLRNVNCYDNKRNFRLWSDSGLLVDRCRSKDPFKRGGTGSWFHYFVIGGATASEVDVPDLTIKDSFCELDTATSPTAAFNQESGHERNTVLREYGNTFTAVTNTFLPAINCLLLHGMDGDVTPPVITSLTAYDTFNKQIFSTVLTADQPVTWRISGGADAGQFTLHDGAGYSSKVANRLALAKKVYAPAGQNGYVVEVEAKDANSNVSTRTITVTVLAAAPPFTFQSTFEGPDNSTAAITDLAGGKTITLLNGAKLTATTPLEGTTSLLIGGGLQHAQTPDHVDFSFANLEFSILALIRPTTLNAFHTIISQLLSTGNQHSFRMGVTVSGALDFIYSLNGSQTTTVRSANGFILANNTYEVAVDRDNLGNLRLYVDGVMVTKVTGVTGTLFNSTDVVDIGNNSLSGASYVEPFLGRIDNLRIWKGYAFCADDAGYTP